MNLVIYIPEKQKLRLYTKDKVFDLSKNPQSVFDYLGDECIYLIDKVSQVSRAQLKEWFDLSSWFDSFPHLNMESAFNMTVLLYSDDCVLLADPKNGPKIYGVSINEINNIFEDMPDYIAYIESVHVFDREQFKNVLSQKHLTEPTIKKKPQKAHKKYIHTVHDGTVLLEDIPTENGPLKLSGKYHFVAIDSIGEDILENSVHFRVLQKKGKVEIVDEDYVQANKHKYKPPKSLASTLKVGSVDDFIS